MYQSLGMYRSVDEIPWDVYVLKTEDVDAQVCLNGNIIKIPVSSDIVFSIHPCNETVSVEFIVDEKYLETINYMNGVYTFSIYTSLNMRYLMYVGSIDVSNPLNHEYAMNWGEYCKVMVKCDKPENKNVKKLRVKFTYNPNDSIPNSLAFLHNKIMEKVNL